jgi:hypothetical protein
MANDDVVDRVDDDVKMTCQPGRSDAHSPSRSSAKPIDKTNATAYIIHPFW